MIDGLVAEVTGNGFGTPFKYFIVLNINAVNNFVVI